MPDRKTQIEIGLEKGDAFVKASGLWLDPHRPREFAFVSHAHADHFAPHGRILCSTPTRALLKARFGAGKAQFLDLEFGETRDLEDGFRATMLPAGHIAGSAMLHLERIEDGATLLHTGDFKTRPALGAERNEPRRADVLIMETTFGIPKFRLPPSEEVLRRMTKYAIEAIEDGEIPMFMAYALGKSQEILLSLHAEAPDLKFQVHSSVEKMNEVVRSLGYDLPETEVFSPKDRSPDGHVVILPPSAGRSQVVRKMRKRVRLAMISGWGMDSSAKYRYQCDEVFPLSDHAGYDDLHTFVDKVSPDLVYTIHGYREDFARDLRERGIEAWPLVGETQLELGLGKSGDLTGLGQAPNPVESEKSDRPESEFGTFTEICESIARVTGKLKKQEILSEYLAGVSVSDLPDIATFLSGNAFSRTAETRSANVGWAVIREAILAVTGLTLAQYRQTSSTQADAGRTAYLVLQGHVSPEPHRISDLVTLFASLAGAGGQSAKVALLADALRTFHHSEGALLVGILTGDLRIGLREGLLEEAIATAFDCDVKQLRSAHMLTGDIGATARMAKEGTLESASASWFTPLKVMLASPADDAEVIYDRLGEGSGSVWLEDKFDGIRAQLHRKGDQVEVYSRDLRPLREEFPELIEAGKGLSHDVILDGEIIAYAEGKRLTFFDLQKRLGRQSRAKMAQGDLFFGEAVPVQFIAFDILAFDGEGCLNEPLKLRREKLESVGMTDTILRCNLTFAESAAEIDEAFNAARKRDNEGLIAKDPTSVYSPGRRGMQWLKLKKAMPTLDVVVVKAQQGHGKRSHVLSDYTFSVRDEQTDELFVVGKAYSGLTDLEIEELTEHFKSTTLEKKRGVHTVEPDTVLEIAFDSINPSKRHSSGLAMRFPRIKAIRGDKKPDEIDTLQYARKLAGVGREVEMSM